MDIIKVKPVEITGSCRANLSLDDEFQFNQEHLENPKQSKLCHLALGQLPPIVLQLQKEHHFFAHASCSACSPENSDENHVLFLLGHADKWELCQAISEYRRLCMQCQKELDAARQLRAAARKYQELGDFAQATKTMQVALKELKRLVSNRDVL